MRSDVGRIPDTGDRERKGTTVEERLIRATCRRSARASKRETGLVRC